MTHPYVQKFLYFLTAFLLLAGLAPLLPDSCTAAANSPKRHVRVGYYITPGFQEYNPATGQYRGYSYEYMLAIAQYADWEYEFIPVDFTTGIQMLENGDLDLMNNVSFLTSRTDTLEFSALPSGRNYTCLVMLPERSEEIAFEEFDKFSRLTVGIVKNRSYTEAFLAYCRAHGFMPKIVYYANTNEARQAWQNGEFDAYVGPSTYNANYHVLAKFYPEEYYFATTKGNTQLIGELNEAMNTLLTDDSYFAYRLYEKYYANMSEENSTLTDVERAYLLNNPVITVIYDPTFYPVSYRDKDGNFAGAMRDIYDLISKKTGLQFQYESHNADLEAEASTSDMSGRDYIVSEMPYDFSWAYQLGVNLTRPFANISCMKVSRSNDEDGGIMAIVDGYFLGRLCQDVYKDRYTYVAYPDTKACIDAVKDGSADCTFMTSYEYEHYSSQSEYRTLFYKVANELDYQIAIAVSKDSAPELNTILDKAINSISRDEIQNILKRTTLVAQKPDLITLLYQHPSTTYPLVLIFSLLLIIVGVALTKRYTAQKNAQAMRLKNDQLEEATAQANSANSSKSRFLAQMSHEIRTPMNAIIGMTAMAHKHAENPQRIREYLGKIDISSKMLLSIINDILDMSAIESNKLKIAHEVFDLKKVLTGISAVYYGQCQSKGIQFDMVLNELEDEILIGDALRVNQILMNLISNAYKFTPAGGSIHIEVSEQKDKELTTFIRFTVTDTGCGMSDNLKKRLFRAFEQESAVTAQKHGGSGLGLAITKNLIDLMHGVIDVTSELGKGTTFVVTLPFDISTDNIRPDVNLLKDIHALIVDDDEGVIEYTGEVLGHMGISYDSSSSGEEALELIETSIHNGNPYDVCLIDWKLPGMSGVELIKKIRQLEPDSNTLLIIISAYDLSEVAQEAQDAGANMYLGKPFFQSILFNALLSVKRRHPVPKKSEKKTYDFTGKKVLLAEDFELDREVALDIFEEVHLEADCAENGREALEMFTASAPGTYDMILMDIQMPEMDGLEATRAIRKSAHPEAGTIPIYAMSANAFSEDVAESLNAGMNGHIAKPIDTDALFKLLDKVLNHTNL